ncbi:MAG: ABC transporter ATP-binding protein [Elusimicrobiota bacterium]
MGLLTAHAGGRPPLLLAESVSKTYRGSAGAVQALDAVSLALEAGSVLGLVGPNGSGKTTLLKVLAGLVTPDSGRVAFDGASLAGGPGDLAAETGFSPGEERSFYGPLSLIENLRFFGRLRGLGERALAERLEGLEPHLGLKGFEDLPYQQASSGVKARLSLARALLHRPRLLLLDEPTRSLDVEAGAMVRAMLRREYLGAPERVLVWSTHRLEEAWETSTEIAVLDRGTLAGLGSPEELLRRTGAANPAEACSALRREASGRPGAPA